MLLVAPRFLRLLARVAMVPCHHVFLYPHIPAQCPLYAGHKGRGGRKPVARGVRPLSFVKLALHSVRGHGGALEHLGKGTGAKLGCVILGSCSASPPENS